MKFSYFRIRADVIRRRPKPETMTLLGIDWGAGPDKTVIYSWEFPLCAVP
jgi:hypothetical protein